MTGSKSTVWQEQLATPSVAEFSGRLVTVRNVRNFRYGPEESAMHPGYYTAAYNLDLVARAWFVLEPFKEQTYAAHSILSFEFADGQVLSVSMEARKRTGQEFSALKGMMRAYPLLYVAADERDVVLLRANLRKDRVYMYPVRATREEVECLLVDVLETMNQLSKEQEWYNTLFANCTTRIFYHFRRLWPGRLPWFSWRILFTAHADELALESGLLDTNLSIDKARKKYCITERSQRIGDAVDYPQRIRQFDEAMKII